MYRAWGEGIFGLNCRRWKIWPVNLTGFALPLRIKDSRWFIFSIGGIVWQPSGRPLGCAAL